MVKRLMPLLALVCLSAFAAQAKQPAQPEDIFTLKEISEARLSPDGRAVVYTVTSINREKNRYTSNLWLTPVPGGPATQLTPPEASDSTPRWSPDSRAIAFASNRDGKAGLWVVDVATRETRFVTAWRRSNHFLSKSGEVFCWSPDSRKIAFAAAERPATVESTDPLVISRIQYKSRTSFSDNLRSHIFVVAVDGTGLRQLTAGNHDEHSVAWSPRGDEILFLSNREKDPDAKLNYDVFAVSVSEGRERRITETPGVEFSPAWSPDGLSIAYLATKRPLTTIDSVAEDAHVWVTPREGGAAIEVSASFDRRASSPAWSADGKWLYFLAGDQGKTLIYRVSSGGGPVSPLFDQPCQVGSLTVSGGTAAFTRSDERSPVEVWSANLAGGEPRPLTAINKELAASWSLVRPENVRFKSFDRTEVEGWLMRPLDLQAGKKYPLILTIHGGPHGMYGYGFSHSNQVYAGRGYALLYLNPRGSTATGKPSLTAASTTGEAATTRT